MTPVNSPGFSEALFHDHPVENDIFLVPVVLPAALAHGFPLYSPDAFVGECLFTHPLLGKPAALLIPRQVKTQCVSSYECHDNMFWEFGKSCMKCWICDLLWIADWDTAFLHKSNATSGQLSQPSNRHAGLRYYFHLVVSFAGIHAAVVLQNAQNCVGAHDEQHIIYLWANMPVKPSPAFTKIMKASCFFCVPPLKAATMRESSLQAALHLRLNAA